MRILVVDDRKDNRDLLRFALERRGFIVITASSCYEALRAIKQAEDTGEFIDAAVLDCAMPFQDGMTCAEQIRMNEGLRPTGRSPIRLAFYSAKERDLDFTKVFDAVHAERDFHKPRDAGDIHELIVEWLTNNGN
jgi:CheY-like chemotaxis protein